MNESDPVVTSQESKRIGLPTRVGLLVALGGFFASTAVGFLIRGVLPHRPAFRTGAEIGVLWDWLLFAAIMLLVVRWERRPLRSIGWRRPVWADVGWAAGALVGIYATLVVLHPLLHRFADTTGAHKLESLPVWLRVLLVVTAPVVEETLFRGYGIERLTELTGNVWIAGLITAVLFAAAHIPFFGYRQVVSSAPVFVGMTLLYIRRRSIVPVIGLHFALDFPLVLA